MITLTTLATEKLKDIAISESINILQIRIRVIGNGCAGFSYDIYFEETEPTENDEKFEQDGVTIVVDMLSFQYLDGTEIDYIDKLFGGGFSFNNPNVSGNCGCGSSFSI